MVYRNPSATVDDADAEPDDDLAIRDDEERVIVCLACRAAVAKAADAIVVDGRHDHRCVNPAGVIYDIRCFSDAAGCRAVGHPEPWFSWFKGTAWQLASCVACGAHLGWRFTGARRFYGLISDRIDEPGAR